MRALAATILALALAGPATAQAPSPGPAPSPPAIPGNLTPFPLPTNGRPVTAPSVTLTLSQAALVAMRNHPELKVSDAQIQAAAARVDLATAPWYPTITGRSSFNYSEAQSAAAGGQQVIRVGFTRNYSMGMTLNQQLFDFGRTRNNVNAAASTLAAVEEDRNGVYQDLMLRVAEAYYQVLREQQSVAINSDVVRNAEIQLLRARGFYEAGTRARIEVTRAEADLATARVSLIQAQNAENRARVLLGTAMGVAQPAVADLVETNLADPDWSTERSLAYAALNRPDVAALRYRTDASNSQLKLARVQYFPTIGTSYNYAWADDIFIPQPYNWSVGVTMSMPILNEPTLSSQVAVAEAALKENQSRQEVLALQVRREVSDAWLNLHAARQGALAAQVARAAAEENYRLAAERYQVGVGSSIEVSDAQRQLVQARSQEVQARFDTQLALARLYRATGTMGIDVMLGLAPPIPAADKNIDPSVKEPPLPNLNPMVSPGPAITAPSPPPLPPPSPAPGDPAPSPRP